jgi:predicted transcriptional regulator
MKGTYLRRISDNELELLKICWSKKECTVREVFEESLKFKNRKYETIKTTMERMVEHKYLTRRKIGPVWLYTPVEPPEQFKQGLVRHFIKTVLNGDILQLQCHLLKNETYSKEELLSLRKIIEEMEDNIE